MMHIEDKVPKLKDGNVQYEGAMSEKKHDRFVGCVLELNFKNKGLNNKHRLEMIGRSELVVEQIGEQIVRFDNIRVCIDSYWVNLASIESMNVKEKKDHCLIPCSKSTLDSGGSDA